MPTVISGTHSRFNLNPSMAGRPRLLFLACYFPPLQASASVRTWNIAKYLALAGWDVTVVTPDPSVWKSVDRTDAMQVAFSQLGVKRILTGYRWRFLSPELLRGWNDGLGWAIGGICRKVCRCLKVDKGVGWIQEAAIACKSFRADDVDLILASGQPFSSFALAKRLSEQLRRPYVLDYRDPWTTPHHGETITWRSVLHQELHLMKSSSAITLVSPSLLNSQTEFSEKTHVITNGYDPEELERVTAHAFGHFAIVYTGIFHPPKRVITPLMQALQLLEKRQVDRLTPWRFHYYGPQGDHVRGEAERYGVLNRVEIHGQVARDEALSATRGAGVAVVITSVLENSAAADKGIVTGKLFDALGLGTSTLIIGPSGADVDEIVERAGLARVVPANRVEQIASFLEHVMSGAKLESKHPEAYAWPTLIRRLDRILRGCLATTMGHN